MGWGRDERVADLFFTDQTPLGNPSEEGLVRYYDSDLVGYINGAVVSLTGAGGGLTPAQHEVLDTLVHELSETSYTKHTYSGWRITNTTIWTTSGMTVKIRETQYTYTAWRVTGVVEIQYNGAGVEVQRLTHAYTYVGNQIDTITTTETP